MRKLLDEWYTPEAVALVQKLYVMDFNRFGYSKQLSDAGLPPTRERWAISQLSA